MLAQTSLMVPAAVNSPLVRPETHLTQGGTSVRLPPGAHPVPVLLPRADEVKEAIPGDLGNEPPLVSGHAVVHHLVR